MEGGNEKYIVPTVEFGHAFFLVILTMWAQFLTGDILFLAVDEENKCQLPSLIHSCWQSRNLLGTKPEGWNSGREVDKATCCIHKRSHSDNKSGEHCSG